MNTKSTNKKPIIIHVTGPSGSGKTTLAEQLNEKGIVTIDTDSFIQGDRLLSLAKATTHESGVRMRDEYFRQEFEEAIQNNSDKNVLVFVGILDHGIGGYEFYKGQKFDVKYYLDIELPILFKQYYTRIVKFADNDDDFWNNCAYGYIHIMGNKQLKQHHVDMKKIHKSLHYKSGNAKEIIEAITKLNSI